MKLRKSLAIAFTLILATGVGTIALANEAKANSEDITRPTTRDNSQEQIDKVITLGACPPIWRCN